MRYAINRTSTAELPKRFREMAKVAIERGRMAKGVPELRHPKDYWEVIDLKTGQRWSNHLDFKPQRNWIVVHDSLVLALEFIDYDFDHMPLPIAVIDHLHSCKEWYWRLSTTCKGVHVMCKHDYRTFDDQTRERATEIRGYSWYWHVKNGHKANSWQKGSKMMAIKFQGRGSRIKLRRKPPTHKKYQKSTVLR